MNVRFSKYIWLVEILVFLGMCFLGKAETCLTNLSLQKLVKKVLVENPIAECEMGRRYAEAGGMKNNLLMMQACYWYKKAAEHGCVEASEQLADSRWASLGFCSQNTTSLQEAIGDACRRKNECSKALVWYRWATASSNCAYTVYERIGDFYRLGEGVEQDDTIALGWYLDASDVTNAPLAISKYYLQKSRLYRKIADMYANGFGVEKNQASARRWYRKADRSRTAFDFDYNDFDFFEWEFDPDDLDLPWK